MAETIDDVIDKLTEIVDWCKQNNSRMGYYTVLYRIVTRKIKTAILQGQFEHSARINQLDIIFANYFISAFTDYRLTGQCTQCWQLVFQLAKNSKLTILQHLMMGINVHVNYDLSLALIKIGDDENLALLKKDFDKINTILLSLADQFARKIASIWQKTSFVDKWIGKIDRMTIAFMMKISRNRSWKYANQLSQINADSLTAEIVKLDNRVTKYGYIIIKARMLANMPF